MTFILNIFISVTMSNCDPGRRYMQENDQKTIKKKTCSNERAVTTVFRSFFQFFLSYVISKLINSNILNLF